jgi:hypothetical protein
LQDYRHAQKREAAHVQGKAPEELVLDPWLVALIRKFPTRFLSSLFGDLMSMECPLLLRRPVCCSYCWPKKAAFDEFLANSIIANEGAIAICALSRGNKHDWKMNSIR